MGNANVAVQGRDSTGTLRGVRTDSDGRLIIGEAGSGYVPVKQLQADGGAYAAGDAVTDAGGLMILQPTQGIEESEEFLVQSLTVVDPADQKAGMDILLFRSDPTEIGADAVATNNAPFEWGTSAVVLLLGKISIEAGDYKSIGKVGDVRAVATLTNLGIVANAAPAAGRIFAVVVTTGTPDYGMRTLTFIWGLEQI